MRKLFRFKYEECNGTCYAYGPAFKEELSKLTDLDSVIDPVVEAHDHMCDNPDYSFGIDMNDDGIYVGFIKTPVRVDTYTDTSFIAMCEKLNKDVMAMDIPPVDGQCEYGHTGLEDLKGKIRSLAS